MGAEEKEVSVETIEEVTETSAIEEKSPEVMEESGTSEEPEKDTGIQKRFNQITAEKYEQKRRADALAEELATLKAATPAVAKGVPKLEDFDYDDAKFNQAYIDHAVQAATAKNIAEQKVSAAETHRTQANKEFARKIAASDIKDYSSVIDTLVRSVPLSEGIIDAIQQDEKGPELAYYLGKHLDVADRLAAVDPIAAALELGRISAGLSGKKTIAPSSAPDPVKTVGSEGGGKIKSYETMSMEEIYNLE